MPYDLLIRNVRVVRPSSVEEADIAITGEKFAKVGRNLGEAKASTTARGGLPSRRSRCAYAYRHLFAARRGRGDREPRRSAGRRHLEPELLPHRPVLPEPRRAVARLPSRGAEDLGGPVPRRLRLSPRAHGFQHIREIPEVVQEHGISSFKIFMFYGSHGLHGRSDSQRDFLMIGPRRYDFAHFEFVMRGVQAARERFPRQGGTDQSVAALRDRRDHDGVHKDRGERGQAGRPCRLPRGAAAAFGGLAVFIASYLANEAALPNINLLHLSSRKALEQRSRWRRCFRISIFVARSPSVTSSWT